MKSSEKNQNDDPRFYMESEASGTVLKVKFNGGITETIHLETLNLKEKTELVLNFNGINYINSAGTRRWMFWMWNIEKELPDLKFSIEKCPTVMLRQIMGVAHFVPKTTQIKSFYAPFYCEACDEDISRLFEVKPLLNLDDQSFSKTISSQSCPKCQGSLTLGLVPEQFNKFVNSYKPD